MNENHGLLVSFNGSKVVDCETNKVLFNETMTVEQGQSVLEHMKKFKVKPMIDKVTTCMLIMFLIMKSNLMDHLLM